MTLLTSLILAVSRMDRYTRDLGVLALKHHKNLSGTRALRELYRRTSVIMCMCKLTWSIPQSKTCSFQTKHAVFMQNELMLHEILIKGYNSLSIRYNDSSTLCVLDITGCIRLEDHYHALGLIIECKKLPPLWTFKNWKKKLSCYIIP